MSMSKLKRVEKQESDDGFVEKSQTFLHHLKSKMDSKLSVYKQSMEIWEKELYKLVPPVIMVNDNFIVCSNCFNGVLIGEIISEPIKNLLKDNPAFGHSMIGCSKSCASPIGGQPWVDSMRVGSLISYLIVFFSLESNKIEQGRFEFKLGEYKLEDVLLDGNLMNKCLPNVKYRAIISIIIRTLEFKGPLLRFPDFCKMVNVEKSKNPTKWAHAHECGRILTTGLQGVDLNWIDRDKLAETLDEFENYPWTHNNLTNQEVEKLEEIKYFTSETSHFMPHRFEMSELINKVKPLFAELDEFKDMDNQEIEDALISKLIYKTVKSLNVEDSDRYCDLLSDGPLADDCYNPDSINPFEGEDDSDGYDEIPLTGIDEDNTEWKEKPPGKFDDLPGLIGFEEEDKRMGEKERIAFIKEMKRCQREQLKNLKNVILSDSDSD